MTLGHKQQTRASENPFTHIIYYLNLYNLGISQKIITAILSINYRCNRTLNFDLSNKESKTMHHKSERKTRIH